MFESAVYRIVVRGDVPEKWADRLGGLEIESVRDEDGERVTVLVGRLRDQAALAGVFTALYTLRLPVVEVKRLEGDD